MYHCMHPREIGFNLSKVVWVFVFSISLPKECMREESWAFSIDLSISPISTISSVVILPFDPVIVSWSTECWSIDLGIGLCKTWLIDVIYTTKRWEVIASIISVKKFSLNRCINLSKGKFVKIHRELLLWGTCSFTTSDRI